MIKLIRWIRGYLPISRKEYYNSLRKVVFTLQAVTQADEQHSQIEMSLIQNVKTLQTGKNEKGVASKDDPAYK